MHGWRGDDQCVPRCAGWSAFVEGSYYDLAKGRGGGDRPVGRSYPPRRPLPLRLARHPPSRLSATFGALGAGAKGEAFGSSNRSLSTVLAATDDKLEQILPCYKYIICPFCKSLPRRQLKFFHSCVLVLLLRFAVRDRRCGAAVLRCGVGALRHGGAGSGPDPSPY